MSRVSEIKAAIEALHEEEYAQLRQRFSERDWEKWDKQIEADSESGRLDFLIQEALDGNASNRLGKEGVSRGDAGTQRMTENELGTIIVESAIAVHRELGPGLLEIVYEVALAYELRRRGLTVERQVPIPIKFRGIKFAQGFRADLLVEDRVIVELKSVERATAAHKKQIQTHLRLAEHKLGYLLNFGEALMKDGITRAVNGLEEWPSPPQRAQDSVLSAGILRNEGVAFEIG